MTSAMNKLYRIAAIHFQPPVRLAYEAQVGKDTTIAPISAISAGDMRKLVGKVRHEQLGPIQLADYQAMDERHYRGSRTRSEGLNAKDRIERLDSTSLPAVADWYDSAVVNNGESAAEDRFTTAQTDSQRPWPIDALTEAARNDRQAFFDAIHAHVGNHDIQSPYVRPCLLPTHGVRSFERPRRAIAEEPAGSWNAANFVASIPQTKGPLNLALPSPVRRMTMKTDFMKIATSLTMRQTVRCSPQ